MDHERFDAWSKTLATEAGSRRGVLRVLAAAAGSFALGVSSRREAAARKPRTGRGQVGAQVVGGTDVPDAKYPFMAVLRNLSYGDTAREQAFCGGSLIDATHVLTAAHCVDPAPDLDDFIVTVGRTRLSNTTGFTRDVARIDIHPFYDGYIYDVAVLELDGPVPNIDPIRPMEVGNGALNTPGRFLTLAGWGEIQSYEDDPELEPDRMKEARVLLQRDEVCNRNYGSGFDAAAMLCAGRSNQAVVCSGNPGYGDSGGPLFENLDGEYRQAGIVNASSWCEANAYVSVYAQVNAPRVAGFIDWATGACFAADPEDCIPDAPSRKKRRKRKKKKRR
jgi:secreted trypsin-like serine protease